MKKYSLFGVKLEYQTEAKSIWYDLFLGFCSFIGNRGLCGKQINLTCKNDSGGGANSQSPNSGEPT